MTSPRTPNLFFTKHGTEEGLFDQLMLAYEKHLEKQFKMQRIQGKEYAEVYIASTQSAMQFTTQYLVANLLIDENASKIRKEIELLDKQIELADSDIEKTKYEIEVLKLQPILTDAQIKKINAEIDYLEAQKAMMDAQKLKIDKEIEFMDAKIRTEYANTVASYADPGSLVGKQKSLLDAQKLGFSGDIRAKAAKMHADFDGIVETVNENGEAVLGENARNTIIRMEEISTRIEAL
jgi:phage shock protein A